MYLQNKYTRWYNNIIRQAKTRTLDCYTETHHIIPRSLGGSNQKDNLVKLTAKEHFVCHHLLVYMTQGQSHYKMVFAFNRMTQCSKTQQRFIPTARHYDIVRKMFAKSMSATLTGVKKQPLTDEHKQKISESSRGHKKSKVTKQRMSESRQAMSAQISENNRNAGTMKRLWQDKTFKQKVSASVSKAQKQLLKDPNVLATRTANINTEVTCKHCGKTMNVGNHNRWHGERCKYNYEKTRRTL